MKTRHEKLSEEITEIEKKISRLPEGEIYCTRNRKWYKWYHSLGESQKTNYIPKSDLDFAQALTYKKYLTLQLEDLIQEKNAIESYFETYSKDDAKLIEFINHPEYQKLLLPKLNKRTQELTQWMNTPYEKNALHPEHLIHTTITGEKVRSKSESLIYMYLKLNNIPFRYECALQLGSVIYYPDFTIRHPKTGDFYYWENNGIMDDPAYVQKAFNKMQVYTLNGIIPGKHLIVTYETSKEPLNAEEVQNLVRRYFL